VSELSPEDWRRIIDGVEPASYAEVSTAVADALDLSDSEGYARVDSALDSGILAEKESDGNFPRIAVDGDHDGEDTPADPPQPTQPRGSEATQAATDGGSGTKTGDAGAAVPESESLDSTDVREHYQDAAPALEALATVDGHPTIGLNDYHGWYIKRAHDDVDLLEAGFDKLGRVASLEHDLDTVLDRIERTLYATTAYKTEDAIRAEQPCTYDDEDGTVWQDGERPTPDYADIRAAPAWGDVDLHDDLKGERGELDAETRATAEATLEAYIAEYADLYGDRSAVYALDSVGGAYIFGAPAATLPIAEHFEDDTDALGRVMEAFVDRSNDWLEKAQERVNDRVDGAASVITPDWVNNKNRQYKAPLSLHADHDAVVTPLDTDSVEYEYTPVEDVDEDLIADTVDWADSLTSTEHTDCVAALVRNLWPDYDDADGWRGALEAWVEDERKAEQRAEQRRRAARERRAERKEELDGDLEGQPITPFIQDVYDDVDDLDVREVIRKHASDKWDTSDRSHETTFDPSWRRSGSGKSCAIPNGGNTFANNGDKGGGGGPATAMALGEGIISDPSQDVEGGDWWDTVDALRDTGYEIRVWTPEKGTPRHDGDEYDKMPFWAVRKAAVALGVVPPEAFDEKETDDGDTYLGFPGPKTYNNALEAIEDAGLEHGREYADTGPSYPVYDVAGNVELHLVPLNGQDIRVAVEQNGQREYTEKQDRGFWENATKRGRIAGRIADELTGVSETELRDGVKTALNDASIDADEQDDWDDRMRSPRERELRDRTLSVVCYPAADSAEYVITMEPSVDSPATEPKEITLEEGDFFDHNAGTFRRAHLAQFHAKAEIDADEWNALTDYWLEVQDVRQRDADHETEAAVEKFIDWVRTMKVWADEDGFAWHNRNGLYREDYRGDQDAVLVPGQKVIDWQHREDAGDVNLSRALRERDVLIDAPQRETAGGDQRRAWPVNADDTNHDADSALVSADEDDEDAPEGLR
jgi:putative DNA primase/helicase